VRRDSSKEALFLAMQSIDAPLRKLRRTAPSQRFPRGFFHAPRRTQGDFPLLEFPPLARGEERLPEDRIRVGFALQITSPGFEPRFGPERKPRPPPRVTFGEPNRGGQSSKPKFRSAPLQPTDPEVLDGETQTFHLLEEPLALRATRPEVPDVPGRDDRRKTSPQSESPEEKPQSTVNTWPVIFREASLRRKATVPVTSSPERVSRIALRAANSS
jgi:hypothetical protein